MKTMRRLFSSSSSSPSINNNNKILCDNKDHPCPPSSTRTAVTTAAEEDGSVRSNTSSTTTTTTPPRTTRVCFADPHDNTIHTIPSRDELDTNAVWWQAEELKQVERDHAQLVKSCQAALTKCTRVKCLWRGQEKQRQTACDLQAIVQCMKQVLRANNKHNHNDCNDDGNEAATQAVLLGTLLDKAPAVRGMEQCLLLHNSNNHQRHGFLMPRQHVTRICRLQPQQSDVVLAQRAADSSAPSVRLAVALARGQAVSA